MKASRGYTLMEVLIVMVLLGLLARLALPAYQTVTRRAHRSEAMSLLQELQLRQEKWRADNSSYASSPEALGAPTSGAVVRHYQLSVPLSGASRYTLRASARSDSPQRDDEQGGVSCAQLEIDQSGTRSPDSCWR